MGKVNRLLSQTGEMPLRGRSGPSCPLTALSFARLHKIGSMDGAFRDPGRRFLFHFPFKFIYATHFVPQSMRLLNTQKQPEHGFGRHQPTQRRSRLWRRNSRFFAAAMSQEIGWRADAVGRYGVTACSSQQPDLQTTLQNKSGTEGEKGKSLMGKYHPMRLFPFSKQQVNPCLEPRAQMWRRDNLRLPTGKSEKGKTTKRSKRIT